MTRASNDPFTDSVCSRTAANLTKLLGLRGLSGSIEWKDGQYWANGSPCGPSVHGVNDWMDKQPGVIP